MKIQLGIILILCITVSFQIVSAQSISVQRGWNLLSLPVNVTDARTTILFPSATSGAFVYQNGYKGIDTLAMGPGFWLKFDSAETISISGEAIYDGSVNITERWNLIGPFSGLLAVNTIISDPSGIVSSQYYGYDPILGYQQRALLLPGKGYWMKANTDGKIIVHVFGGPCPDTPTISYGGKIYNTVQIGSQCWLKENLDVGTMVDSLQNQTDNSIIEKYCYRNDTAICRTYGGFYQWNEAMQYSATEGAQGICPNGWHVPTYAQLHALLTIVNNDVNALKAIGQGIGEGIGTNASGFSALFSGLRLINGSLNYQGESADIWSSTQYDATAAFDMALDSRSTDPWLFYDYKALGFSVRCIKD